MIVQIWGQSTTDLTWVKVGDVPLELADDVIPLYRESGSYSGFQLRDNGSVVRTY